jgi:hypothetical protein
MAQKEESGHYYPGWMAVSSMGASEETYLK